MSTLSRRTLVTSAAALPALAVPAAISAAVEPDDPIYAAIKKCVEAERAAADAMTRLDDAQTQFKEKYGLEHPDAFRKEIREMWATTFLEFAQKNAEAFGRAAA
jgi:hypothetical protein